MFCLLEPQLQSRFYSQVEMLRLSMPFSPPPSDAIRVKEENTLCFRQCECPSPPESQHRRLSSSSSSSSSSSPTSPTSPSSLLYDPRANHTRVQFLNLKQIYLKAQSRVGRESKQRLMDGRIRMIATVTAQIEKVLVFVERTPEAAVLCNDNTGRVQLAVKMGDMALDKQYFSVDLDSVYLAPRGMPVYKLSTVDADKRNRFRLVVMVICLGDVKSRPYYSRSFLIRSRRSSRQESTS